MKLLFIILLLNCCLLPAQVLDGKCMLTKEQENDIRPRNLIMEFRNDSVAYYNFKSLIAVNPVKYSNNGKFRRSGSLHKFEFISKDRVIFFVKGRKSNARKTFRQEFVRVRPTHTTLTKGMVENMNFRFNWNGEVFTIYFKSKNNNVLKPGTNKGYIQANIEVINNTWFVVFYKSGNIDIALPIQTVNKERMILYGANRKPYELLGEAI